MVNPDDDFSAVQALPPAGLTYPDIGNSFVDGSVLLSQLQAHKNNETNSLSSTNSSSPVNTPQITTPNPYTRPNRVVHTNNVSHTNTPQEVPTSEPSTRKRTYQDEISDGAFLAYDDQLEALFDKDDSLLSPTPEKDSAQTFMVNFHNLVASNSMEHSGIWEDDLAEVRAMCKNKKEYEARKKKIVDVFFSTLETFGSFQIQDLCIVKDPPDPNTQI